MAPAGAERLEQRGARTSPRIRKAQATDARGIQGIYNEAVRSTTATFDTEPRSLSEQEEWLRRHDSEHPVIVAESDGTLAGWAALSPWSDRRAYARTAEISVYVAASWRNQRVGTALMVAILAEARRVGFHMILARIAEGNPVSRRLHLAAGFRTVGVMHEVGYKFDRFLDVELLELRIESESPA